MAGITRYFNRSRNYSAPTGQTFTPANGLTSTQPRTLTVY